MIKLKCNTDDEYLLENCLCYDCKWNNCDDCQYAEENIQFETSDNSKIEIETDDEELDIKTCIYNTFYNYSGCGIAKDGEDCSKCRFWYENVLIKYIKQ